MTSDERRMRVWAALDMLAHRSQRRSHSRADYAMVVRVRAKGLPGWGARHSCAGWLAAEAAPENLTATKPACAGWDSGTAPVRRGRTLRPRGPQPRLQSAGARRRAFAMLRWGDGVAPPLPTADGRARARRDRDHERDRPGLQ